MQKSGKPHEKFLYEIWKSQKFEHSPCTEEGEHIFVLDAGIENVDLPGPDFKNARIKIGNITYVGDIEIDGIHSDWKTHGHNLNKKYNKVILHAVLSNDSGHNYVYTQDGRKVQSVCISSFLEESLRDSLKKAILSERKKRINKMPCAFEDLNLTQQEKLDFLFDLGLERFKKKCERMFSRLKELSYLKSQNVKEPVIRYELTEDFYDKKFIPSDFDDVTLWEQLVYEGLFEALGYSKNKSIMHHLSQSANISFFKTFALGKNKLPEIEAALFSIGGVIPDKPVSKDEDVLAYIARTKQLWDKIKVNYDGRIYDEEQWNYFKLRPQNFPTIRLAGGARILHNIINENLLGRIIKKFIEIKNEKVLTNSVRSQLIVKSDGFWKQHYMFKDKTDTEIKYFVGISRADEIFVNVILPFVSIYFEIFNKKDLHRKVINLYQSYVQVSHNNLVDEVANTLTLNEAWKRSILYHGMIELFRDYCSKDRCKECYIGKQVFN